MEGKRNHEALRSGALFDQDERVMIETVHFQRGDAVFRLQRQRGGISG